MVSPAFSKIRTVHFIGIGGIGTSAIARMFVLEGPSTGLGVKKKVSGSDMAESEVTNALKDAGADIFVGEDAKNIPAGCDLVIYTIAISKEHAELVEAKKRGIPVLSYPEALGVISKDKYTIAITGTHGKTTTTAMVAKIMIDAGLDPTVIVGSFLLDTPLGKSPFSKGALHSDAGGLSQPPKAPPENNPPKHPTLLRGKGDKVLGRTNFVAGKSKYLVVEGCEYRRSFLNLHPTILVITNIDADHLDYYKDLDDIRSAFTELAAKVPKDGAVLKDFSGVSLPEGFKLRIPGKHNLENAKAALAVARMLGIADAEALRSLADFRGTWRRFEYRGQAGNGAEVYDDYGHHPTEIRATLQGARELFPLNKGGAEGGGCAKIVVVFQPHLYSRTRDHLAEFGKCFALADEVILLPVYAARKEDAGGMSSETVVAEIKKNKQSAHSVKTFAEAAALAEKLSATDDLILTLGAGETNRVADLLVSEK